MVNREYADSGGNDPAITGHGRPGRGFSTSEAAPAYGLIPCDPVDKQPHKPIRV